MTFGAFGATRHTRPDRRVAGPWRHIAAAAMAVLCLVAGTLAARHLWQRWQRARYEQRGVAFGVTGLIPGESVDPWATNVALEQYPDEESIGNCLDTLSQAGFRWVRQRFPWSEIEPSRGSYDWEKWDGIVRQCQRHGFRLIALIDGSPSWARTPEDLTNPYAPPRNPADLASFARAFAERYGSAIDYYQIWDEPNIYPHWGERDASAEGYLCILKAARTQIRDVDPDAVLVCAGLAPTTEISERNVSELAYLRAIYDAGGQDLFDVVALKPYGFWSGPEDRVVAEGKLNFSRLVAAREEMLAHGDRQKPIWAVAWGWNTLPPGWQGRPSPWGSDEAWRQYDRDLRAIRRAQEEWPWLGLMCYATAQPAAPSDDPVWGFALLDQNGRPTQLYYEFERLAQKPHVLYPGYHTLQVDREAGAVEVLFWGNRVDLTNAARWEVASLDGRLVTARAPAEDGSVTLAKGLPLTRHSLMVRPLGMEQTVQVVVSREAPPWLPARTAAALIAAALLAVGVLWYLLRPYPWRRWCASAVVALQRLPSWPAAGGGALLLAALALAPNPGVATAMLAVLCLYVLVRPDTGLMLAAFLVPLAPLHRSFGPASFSYLEIMTLLTVASQGWLELRRLWVHKPWRTSGRMSSRLWAELRRLDALDVGLVLLVGVSFLSLLASENLRVSLRELRVVVLQAAFLYWLVRSRRLDREGILQLVDAVVLGAVLVSLQGLYQFIWTDDIIVAEGVRRMRGIYGSPNNLALVLGRVWPLLLAVLLCGARGARRWAYGLVALSTGACLFLTFSKGAWFFGIPAALFALAVLTDRRTRIAVAALAAVGVLGALPLLGTARIGSLFSLQGTSLFRIKLWEASWEMAWDHPWLGVGLDNFLYQYPRYIRPEAMSEPELSHPHNVLLDFWLRLGVPGLAALGWLEWSFFRQALRLWRRRSDRALWVLNVGMIAAMLDMLAHGLVDASFFVVELAGLCSLFVALTCRMGELELAEHPR